MSQSINRSLTNLCRVLPNRLRASTFWIEHHPSIHFVLGQYCLLMPKNRMPVAAHQTQSLAHAPHATCIFPANALASVSKYVAEPSRIPGFAPLRSMHGRAGQAYADLLYALTELRRSSLNPSEIRKLAREKRFHCIDQHRAGSPPLKPACLA